MNPDIAVPCTYDPAVDTLYSYLIPDHLFSTEYDHSTPITVTLEVTVDLDRVGNIIGVEIPSLRETLNGAI